MSAYVVVGTQWGDEGKGKITDYLGRKSDVVVRYQGGNNAGHTIVFDNKKYALHLIPSGIFNKDTVNVMANGMVINLAALKQELEYLHENGITDYNLKISDRAHIIMPYHIELDKFYETLKADKNIGTTHKGIGPAYTDKAARFGIRIGDLFCDDLLDKIDFNVKLKNQILADTGIEFNAKELYNQLLTYKELIKDFVCDTSVYLEEELKANKNVLFEGAQGVMLCLDNGTYPFVTSSSPTASSVPLNAGVNLKYISTVYGVTKAYSTRVGSGFFTTEFEDETAHKIREVGREYGTTTGRPRRIGWFDAVVVSHARRVASVNVLSIMLLDVLTGIDKLKICVAYELDGKKINYVPANISDLERCKPIYVELDGWHEDITSVKSFDELPENAKNYLRTIEQTCELKVGIISVGPDRLQTIEVSSLD